MTNQNLVNALHKSKWESGREYFCGYLTQPEMLELVKLGAKFREHHKAKVNNLKDAISVGNVGSSWYYFVVTKELREKIDKYNGS